MHVNLSSHLHTDECNKLINKLFKCYEAYKYGKFFGFCNGEYDDMRMCLRGERKSRQRENYLYSAEIKRRQKCQAAQC
ncbi:COX assembly mitochondrial protein 2 homolog [Varroa destructor]|uniref:COX assembly mitochondrial protein n=1 Tax=Varroa destructor TaxID=109461 RepID=A0A7M7KFS2_VARDE|nr:COX assembly mitochondrial protein 2 homolog [Varroa destructor]